MKKILIILISFIPLLSLISCSCTSYEDLEPAESEFSEWDQNYIYFCNYRCKTTGEDEEVLITDITYNNVLYTVDCVSDYEFKDDDIYMCLRASSDLDTINENGVNFVVTYSIRDKTTKIIFFTDNYDLFVSYIKYIHDDYMVLIEYSSYNHGRVLKIDLSDYSTKYITDLEDFWVQGDYVLTKKDNLLKYTNLNNDTYDFIDIGPISSGSCLQMLYICGKYLMRIWQNKVENGTHFSTLYYYDFDKNEVYYVWDKDFNKELTLIGDEYFIVSDYSSYDYYTGFIESYHKSSFIDFYHKREIFSAIMHVNNELYKLNFDDEITCSKIYTFEDDASDYTNAYISEDGDIVGTKKWVKKGSPFLIEGGTKKMGYKLDLETLELQKCEDIEESNAYEPIREIEFGNSKYYFEKKRYGGIEKNYVYFFYKYNIETDEKFLMQFFSYDENIVQGVRYSNTFSSFVSDGSFNSYFFKIENY